MAYKWIKLEHVMFPNNCLFCKKMINHDETAFWLKGYGLMHPNCGLGSKLVSKLLSIYTEDPTYDRNPFEHILEHGENFYAAKEWRDSLDN